MGRPKKPTSLKILQGSANAKRAAKTEPRPIAKAPLCPSWLSAEAKSHWEEITDKLEPLGLATSLDRDETTHHQVPIGTTGYWARRRPPYGSTPGRRTPKNLFQAMSVRPDARQTRSDGSAVIDPALIPRTSLHTVFARSTRSRLRRHIRHHLLPRTVCTHPGRCTVSIDDSTRAEA